MKNKQFFVIAQNIRSLQNVGSIFRSADAFGITRLFLTGYTGTPENPVHKARIGKVALGAEETVAWEYAVSASKVIKRLKVLCPGIAIIGLENNLQVSMTQSLYKFKPRFPIALVLGEEVRGINRYLLKFCDQLVEIPMMGQKESLNVSVAFGIAAYEISKSRNLKLQFGHLAGNY